jgi:hypothetical protein
MLKFALLFLALATPLLAMTNDYPDCDGTINNQTVIDATPQLIGSVTNGKRYTIQSSINSTHLDILVLQGSWYDIGYAYGTLMKSELNTQLPLYYEYIVNQTEVYIELLKDYLPIYLKWLPNLMSLGKKELLAALLGLQYQFNQPYTPQRYLDQFQGMADATGLDVKYIIKLNLFPELIRAQCSMAGIWGSASADGNLLQLRALDWQFNAYMVNFPEAIIYFPTEAGSNPFATFGFTGMIGAISGYSNKVAISEKVWLPQSTAYKSELGEPFAYVLRDILQFGNDLESSIGIVSEAKRTCRIHVGIGAHKDNSFEGLQISYNELYIFNDKNYTNYTDAHPQMDGVMYWDKHPQPSKNKCLGQVLSQNLGHMDAEFLYNKLAPLHKTGDTQIVVYDFARETVYLSYSDPQTGALAYARPLLKLDMGYLLNQTNFF